jgi:hypothetical protein
MTKTAEQRRARNEAYQLLMIAARLLREAGLDGPADDLAPVFADILADTQAGQAQGRADAARRLATGKPGRAV